jgi:ABC-type nitrate/sulfonate/bicarbonate transport system permease component
MRIRVGIRVTQVGLNSIDQGAAAPVVRFLTTIRALVTIVISIVWFLTTIPAIVTIVISVIIAITVAVLRVRGQRHEEQAAAGHSFHQEMSHLSSLLVPRDAQGARGGAGVAIIYR